MINNTEVEQRFSVIFSWLLSKTKVLFIVAVVITIPLYSGVVDGWVMMTFMGGDYMMRDAAMVLFLFYLTAILWAMIIVGMALFAYNFIIPVHRDDVSE